MASSARGSRRCVHFLSFHTEETLWLALLGDRKDLAAVLWVGGSLLVMLGTLVFAGRPIVVSIALVASCDIRLLISPDIYWIVLDGHPRVDVLHESFGVVASDSRAPNQKNQFSFRGFLPPRPAARPV